MPAKMKAVKGSKIHYSYAAHVGQPARRDLKFLATCNNINGPVGVLLTSDLTKVTCGRCRRIQGT